MPTYEYACTECGHDFEQFQSFSDDALTECPECSGRLRKRYNAVGVVFKGSGFYRTDSRAAAGMSEPGSASETKPDTSEKTEKSEKSEKKADAPVSTSGGTSDSSNGTSKKTGSKPSSSSTPASTGS